ncbi:MAG: cell division protein FtsZ [Candidatus Dadabacteria bacterium]|nr:MAG: cell division protein FtsZ [Candidatus Dadabacteria bacterium]
MNEQERAEKLQQNKAVIKVLGIGGAGVNAVNNMISSGLEGVGFYTANTDAQALLSSKTPNQIQLGADVTKGLGAGADPDIGLAAARESSEDIRSALDGADMVFIAAGMGGGTGTLGSTVVAEIAKDLGCLTVAVVTKPFVFEGKKRMKNAERGLEELRKNVDTLITIPNQRLLSIAGRNTSLLETFRRADDILFQAVKGISDLIIYEGLINVDFADVRAVMSEMGMAMMGTGEGVGENRAIEAAEKAISSPLLEDISIHGARGVLINITASPDVTLQEINEAAELIHAEAHEDANIIWGMVIDENLEDKVKVTVIATGFGDEAREATTLSLTHISTPSPRTKTNVSMIGKENKNKGAEVIKLKKLSVLSNINDEEKYEIPTFLRRQMD